MRDVVKQKVSKDSPLNVCVVGLGYIGLPTASVLASRGHQVRGVEINPKVVETYLGFSGKTAA
jgi:UDP-N-acetyl-D-mannosaminuronate dehydrogenase